MDCITLLLVTGKRPVKYVYNFPVSGSARTMDKNKDFLLSSLQGKNMFPSPMLDAHFLLIWCFFCVWSKCPKIVASDFGSCAAINAYMRSVHVAKFPFFTSLIKVDFTGLKHVACKNLLTLLGFYFS